MKKKKIRVDKPVFTNLSLLGRFVNIKTDENGFLVLPDFVESNDFLLERVLRYLSNFVKVEVEEDSDTQAKVEVKEDSDTQVKVEDESKEEKKEIEGDTKNQEETVTEEKINEQEEAKPKRQRRTRSS